MPAELSGAEALPEQQRQKQSEETDEHEDPADDVDVDRWIRILVHGEREDGADGDQDQADGKAHLGPIPACSGCQTVQERCAYRRNVPGILAS